MRRFSCVICLCALALMLAVSPGAADSGEAGTPMVSFGAGVTYGYYNFITSGDDTVVWEGGTGYGGGLVFEYMWNDVFGVHSGLWYAVSIIDLKFDEDDPMTVEARTEHLLFPLYLITSYRRGRFGIGLLTGLNFMYVRKSEFYASSPMGSMTLDVSEYLRYDLYGLAGGFEMKFGVARFVDIFLGGLAEFYMRGFIKDTSGSVDYLYDFRVMTGVLFRTY